MADLKVENTAELENRIAGIVEEAVKQLRDVAKGFLVDMAEVNAARVALPAHASDLLAMAKVALVKELVVEEQNGDTARITHATVTVKGEWSQHQAHLFDPRPPTWEAGGPAVPPGRYRVVLFLLPVET